MKSCCRNFFCCSCCRKNPLNQINDQSLLLPKNERTKDDIELDELYVFGSAPEELRKVYIGGYGRKPAKKIVCGKSHCLILLRNNELVGFGSNEEGQLGLSLDTKVCNQTTKITLSVNNENLEHITIKDIAAGEDFSLILIKTQNDEEKIIKFGAEMINKYINIPNSQVQKILSLPEGVNNICHIYAFEKRTAFYTPNKEVYIGGRNFNGADINEFQLLKSFNNHIESLYLQKESIIVLDSSNQIFGLGDNSYQELGLGLNYSTKEFRKLGFRFQKCPIKKICAGARHLLFLLANGEVFCVGDNSESQCCGSTSHCSVPIKLEINSKEKVVDCFAGYNHNLILLENGSVYTWGNSANGKLGYYEDKFSQDYPREILGMKIKCINNVCLGYQMTVITTGQQQDSLIIKNTQPNIAHGINEMN